MDLTVRSLAALAALGMSIAAPVTSASAVGTPAGFPAAGALPSIAPVMGSATVVGPAIITTAPTTFVNTNNQVTAGSAVSGGQLAVVP
jgi:hypothetical protein